MGLTMSFFCRIPKPMTQQDKNVLRAIQYCGSQKKLAARMGCAQQQVSKLLNDQRAMTFEWALRIEDATDGHVGADELLPPLAEWRKGKCRKLATTRKRSESI